ncbi:cyclic nucleotide-binding domain-containing protein [Microvirga sp. W0021]|uniref:Cyclic nucleotide-binding domain-containing protein n=1 Tax=Hohaiivirga grylli TaxID=3133970 RepID=A0ABV0BJ55_9HYPH
MALGDDISILAETELFNLFEVEALRLIAFAAERRSLKKDDLLFRKGDRADCGYVVISGSLRVEKEHNDKTAIIAKPGTLIGRLALFVRNVRPATATALEPSELLRISPTLLRKVLEEFPDCANAAHDALSADLIEFTENLEKVRHLFEDDEPNN